jgi:hypothetical protein
VTADAARRRTATTGQRTGRNERSDQKAKRSHGSIPCIKMGPGHFHKWNH